MLMDFYGRFRGWQRAEQAFVSTPWSSVPLLGRLRQLGWHWWLGAEIIRKLLPSWVWLMGSDDLKTELSSVSPKACAMRPLHVAGASSQSAGLEYLLFLHFGAPRVSVPGNKTDAAWLSDLASKVTEYHFCCTVLVTSEPLKLAQIQWEGS